MIIRVGTFAFERAPGGQCRALIVDEYRPVISGEIKRLVVADQVQIEKADQGNVLWVTDASFINDIDDDIELR